MRVLITGGAGFIGSHVAGRILADGGKVRVLDNLSTGKRENLSGLGGAIELIEGDIRDTGDVRRCMQDMDAVVHLAAVASVQASIDDPVATHQSNFDGTLNLLEAARTQGVQRFVYASSAAIYGDTDALPVAEEEKPRPLSPYAVDKLAGEYYLSYYFAKHRLPGTAFRFFNIYGPRQDPSSPYSGVISIFVDRLYRGEAVTLFGDGNQTRDFVYVADLADILVRSLTRGDLAGQVMNVGTGTECSLLRLLDELEQVSGKEIPRRFAAPRVGDILRSRARVDRLVKAFGSAPATPIGTGLRQLLASVSG
jgi:UDP-glucose 4-epimerase